MIYIAGPFFTYKQRDHLNSTIKKVRELYPEEELFIPMEHFIPDGENMPNNEWTKKVFDMDIAALNKADLVIATYLDQYSDTGTAWEIGYAYAQDIPVYLIIPEEYRTEEMSIMPIQSSKYYCKELLIQK